MHSGRVFAPFLPPAAGSSGERARGTLAAVIELVAVLAVAALCALATAVAVPRRSTGPAKARWVAAGEAVDIAGFRIDAGLFWFGRELAAVDPRFGVEPALVDPQLAVRRRGADPTRVHIGPLPSWQRMSPVARGAYLAWLASGRAIDDVEPGYAFLFLFGLERYVFGAPIETGLAEVARELDALLARYGSETSIAQRVMELRDVLALVREGAEAPLDPSGVGPMNGKVSLRLRVAIGRAAKDHGVLPVELALLWATNDPEIKLRTSATRCSREFASLFRKRFCARWKDGLSVRVTTQTLRVEYRPASRSFGGRITVASMLPDVTSLARPRRSLLELVDQCSADLDDFSRFVGRRPAERDSLLALALLPRELAAERRSTALDELRARLDATVESGGVIGTGSVLAGFGVGERRASRKESARVIAALEHLGFGIEPDVRFGGPGLHPQEECVVFRVDARSPRAMSPRYAASTLLLHLGAMVAGADEAAGDEERQRLTEVVTSAMHATGGERDRLAAHSTWLLRGKPGWSNLERRLRELQPAERDRVADFAVRVALADGRIDPREVKVLTRIHTLLGLDPDRLHRALHDGALGRDPDDPATIPAAGPLAGEGETGDERAALDMELVAIRLRETAAVAALLAGVFADEASTAASSDPEPQRRASTPLVGSIAGLDSAHVRLLHTLGERGVLTRAEYETEAEALGLMPDGALETINDLAFERCDAPLCDGDDPIQVDPDVYSEFMS